MAQRGNEVFAKIVATLAEGNLVWAQHAPLLVAVAQTVREGGKPNGAAIYDLGQAVAHLSVQAAADGRLDQGLRVRERAPRSRKPLSEFVFGGTWGQASRLTATSAE